MLLAGTNAEYQFSGNTFKISGSGNDAACALELGKLMFGVSTNIQLFLQE
jgi:hypothetical protein